MRRLLLILTLIFFSFGTYAQEEALRIGDILTVSLPGEAALSKDFQIDRKGRVTLPEVGALVLSGKTPAEAEKLVRERLGKAFRDLDRLTVVLKERRLLVSVLGYVKTPGPVELPGDATVQMAINTAGGLSQGAQLDRVQVRRGKQTLNFDYKKYLDSGDTSLLPDLQPLDTVFVPASPLTGNVQIEFDGRTLAAAGDGAEERTAIKVFGEVNTPAIFAYKPGVTAVDMLMRAGGVTRYAAVEQIRIINQGKPILFNLQNYLDTGDKAQLPDVQPGATLFVPKQMEEIRRGASTVYVMGEVAKPGAFDGKPGATFIDVLANAGGPTRFADTRQIRVLRADGKVEMVDLPRYTENPNAAPLPPVRPGDAIFVPEKMDTNEPSWLKIAPGRAVQVLGAVYKPGRFEWSDEMTFFDLIAQAGGPTARADVSHVQIIKSDAERAKPTLFDLGAFLDKGGDLASVPKIRAGTIIMVPELPQDPADNKAQWTRQASDRSIHIMGQVGAPGRYAFSENFSFMDILSAANGPTSGADLRNIRISHRDDTKGAARVTKLDFTRYLETGDGTLLPRVKPGDVIFVPERNGDWLDQSKENTVRVLGAVGKAGRYRFSDDMSLLDLLAEAGGPASDAYQEKILVVNLGCCQEQARIFDLVNFAKTGDVTKLPVVRPGDTVYVPTIAQSDWKIFMDGVRDTVSVLSIFALIGGAL
jgi:protein involved in polysaccharide export with SLBB domain